MNTLKKLLLVLAITFSSINLFAYSYAAAGKEPTIDSREKILKFVNINDFKNVKKEFIKAKKNYDYLSGLHNSDLSLSLSKSIENKDINNINKWLNTSIAAEVNRRLDGGLKNIKVYNISKVMLAKANKFYKLLEPSLTKEQNKELSTAIKNCIKSIGNPGLFGVGARPASKEEFIKNQKLALKILKSI